MFFSFLDFKHFRVKNALYHLMAQLIIGTFHAFIYIIQNPIKFRISKSTKDLINFLLQNVIGPWMIFRIAIRLGDVVTMMRVFYTDFQHLAVCTNSYNYAHITVRSGSEISTKTVTWGFRYDSPKDHGF